ncbi:hypothetical protein TVAG_073640 [Trichomonas vaginalis G3]|uniref:Uncharacterized protein n=1 Tax=Trichomonas vaginalis (strain ATCC PRA-98 / G3) TaxID=412133 RepID=A2EEA0_TRIV3|nr:hypothetical protein TVAGG3_0797920 [Trichomonas vaginalis G3]EAY08998.1 hypothetical protein TVAG_073640 [Trichomonas vaginalis G3]KAI5496293.1 hypothetical protein TVAGG3_0797920 [Trichomonas vaginalis G3]|eukprot:XP_001321221.1 hypothetical protein [Trichomonas vaginalis G3]
MFLSISHKEWDNFYNSSNEYTPYRNESKMLDNSSPNSYYVSLCLFIYLNQTGAIRITDETDKKLKFLIDTSSFYKCMHESDKGGSLYISCTKGECIQDRICSFGSNTVTIGAYCYISVSEEYPFKNYLLDSTITSSGEENPKENSNIDLVNDETYMKSINISHSKLNYHSFYYVHYNSNSNGTLSTFSNNTSTEFKQVIHYGSSDSIEFTILFCNYFENKCENFIDSQFNLYLNNCNFYKNNVKYNYFSTDGQMQVQGCYFDISDPVIAGLVTITENASSIYPENHHLNSGLCYAELKLGFSEEKKTKTEEKAEIIVNNKRNNKFNFLVCIFLSYS